MLRIVPISLVLACALLAQGDKPATDSKAAKAEVTVPSYRNASCPLMGKPAKDDVFVDSAHGRVWLCCKNCLAKAKKDPDGTYAKAYPTATKVNNKMDPIDGKPVKDGVTVVYQGYEINLSDASHAKAVLQNGDVYVTLLTKPDVRDVKNTKDPVNGNAVADNMVVLIGNSLVHISSADSIEAIKKDPAKSLEKAEKSAKKA
jgi:hypothetical protein